MRTLMPLAALGTTLAAQGQPRQGRFGQGAAVVARHVAAAGGAAAFKANTQYHAVMVIAMPRSPAAPPRPVRRCG